MLSNLSQTTQLRRVKLSVRPGQYYSKALANLHLVIGNRCLHTNCLGNNHPVIKSFLVITGLGIGYTRAVSRSTRRTADPIVRTCRLLSSPTALGGVHSCTRSCQLALPRLGSQGTRRGSRAPCSALGVGAAAQLLLGPHILFHVSECTE